MSTKKQQKNTPNIGRVIIKRDPKFLNNKCFVSKNSYTL